MSPADVDGWFRQQDGYQKTLEHFICWQAYIQMLNLFFQQALAPAHWTKTTTKYVLNMVAPSSIGQPTHPSWTP